MANARRRDGRHVSTAKLPDVTRTQTNLLKQSFRRFVPVGNRAAALFYARLFELEPSVRTLFAGSTIEHGARLTSNLAALVAMSHRLDLLLPYANALGANHVPSGVREPHYVAGAEALRWTLEKALGAEFGGDERDAWIRFIRLVTRGVIEGAATRCETGPSASTFVAV